MKRIDLVRKVEQAGCLLIRHGGKHEIKEALAQHILRKSGIE